MSYNVTLVQVNANIGGMGVANTSMGFPTDVPFDNILFSFWTCLPSISSPPNTSNGGPSYSTFFLLNAGSNGHLKLGNMPTTTWFFDGTFDTPVNDIRSHHLISVDCASQTVQYYVNDAPVSLLSGGWTGTGQFLSTPTVNIWDFDIGSGFGLVYPAFADLWMAKTSGFVDLSITTNRRLFITAELEPVDLGVDGSVPLGSLPQIFQTIPSGGVPNDFLINRGLGIDFGLTSGSTLTFQEAGKCTLPTPRSLQLVSLYPIDEPDSQYGFTSSFGANFSSGFSQLSLSVWCCKVVTLRSPGLLMAFSPSAISITAKDVDDNVLFSGAWTNPTTPHDEYQVLFSLDTFAQTYTLYVSNQLWTVVDVSFPNTGDIHN